MAGDFIPLNFTHCPDEEGTEIPVLMRQGQEDKMNFTHCPDEEGTEIAQALAKRLGHGQLHSLPR